MYILTNIGHTPLQHLNLFHDTFTHIITIQFIVYNICDSNSPASIAVISRPPFHNPFSPGKYTLYIHLEPFFVRTPFAFLDPFLRMKTFLPLTSNQYNFPDLDVVILTQRTVY